MKKLLLPLIVSLALPLLPSCSQRPPRDPEKVRRSEARKKRNEEKLRRRLDNMSRQSAIDVRTAIPFIG
jgi:hypothetical protein